MHGLINKSIQLFLVSAYGAQSWRAIAARADLPVAGFEAMLHYDDAVTDRLLAVACDYLARPADGLLEDLGAHLASVEAVRRLLRYGGRDYRDFLKSLGELPGRCQMVLPDLHVPELMLIPAGAESYLLELRGARPEWGPFMAGLLRAMADDYGALALIETGHCDAAGCEIRIDLLDTRHAKGRGFDLAGACR